jgi:hypothetical protein
VVLKGKTMLTYEPKGDHNTTKKATTESRNKIQNNRVFFLVVSILKILANIRQIFLYVPNTTFDV